MSGTAGDEGATHESTRRIASGSDGRRGVSKRTSADRESDLESDCSRSASMTGCVRSALRAAGNQDANCMSR